MAVGSLEPQFYSQFLEGLGLEPGKYVQEELEKWDVWKKEFEAIFAQKTQQEWVQIYSKFDCCVTPVVDFDDAPNYHHNKARGAFLADNSPRPAPVLGRTPATPDLTEARFGQHTEETLLELGYSREDIIQFLDKEAIAVDETLGLSSAPKSKL
jgi:alpha-methylacyl-CoA racemase